MVNRLAGLVVLGACGWGAVVLVLCGVQLAGETVAWVANGGLGRLPGWAWPLISAGVLGLVGVAWFRWLWPGEVAEEIERRGPVEAEGVSRGMPRSECEAEMRYRAYQRARDERAMRDDPTLSVPTPDRSCPTCGSCSIEPRVQETIPYVRKPDTGSKSGGGSVGGPDIGGGVVPPVAAVELREQGDNAPGRGGA